MRSSKQRLKTKCLKYANPSNLFVSVVGVNGVVFALIPFLNLALGTAASLEPYCVVGVRVDQREARPSLPAASFSTSRVQAGDNLRGSESSLGRPPRPQIGDWSLESILRETRKVAFAL